MQPVGLSASIPAKGGACKPDRQRRGSLCWVADAELFQIKLPSTLPFCANLSSEWGTALVGHLWSLGYRFCSSDRKVYEDVPTPPSFKPSRFNYYLLES
jgi:hypothetical protein